MWVVYTLALASSCTPNTQCTNHRNAEFGNTATYNRVISVLFNASGCPLSCIDQCECTCTGGIVNEMLAADPVPYCSGVCNNPVLKRAINYLSTLSCDTVFAIAQKPLLKLCATNADFGCANGECDNIQCSQHVDAPADHVRFIKDRIIMAAITYMVISIWFIPTDLSPIYTGGYAPIPQYETDEYEF